MMPPGAGEDLVHATCVALSDEARDDDSDRPVQGILLRGAPGSGKSDLALRLIDAGWRLVADDQCSLRRDRTRLWARAPAALAGRIEVRGLGLVTLPHVEEAPVALLVDLVEPAAVDRLPESETVEFLGVAVPRLQLHAFDLSAPAKLRLALRRAQRPIMPARGGGLSEMCDRTKAEQGSASASAATRAADDGAARQRRRLVLVTGLSGAGRSTALNILEDIGYEAIDNLPLDLLEASLSGEGARPIALGFDIRARNFAVEPLLDWADRLRNDPGFEVTLLYLHCDDDVLRQRYSETRRRHPLALDRPLSDGIMAERRLIAPLNARADLVVDTSSLAPAEFRTVLTGHLGLESAAQMSLLVMSFSYRQGLPRAADLVFDVRFLRNPHYDRDLRPLTGRDSRVASYIRSDPEFEPFYGRLKDLLLPLLPRYESEGKSYLTVAFGCTGGRHRSVMLAEWLTADLREQGCRVSLAHRDLDEDHNERASARESA